MELLRSVSASSCVIRLGRGDRSDVSSVQRPNVARENSLMLMNCIKLGYNMVMALFCMYPLHCVIPASG